MCLISDTNKPLIAQEDIVCYKILVRKKYFIFSIYRTPVTDTIVFPFLLKRFNIPFKARGKEKIHTYICDTKYIIEKGFIHTYSVKWVSRMDNIKTFECVIPKGTEYFVNIRGEEYASKKIKFIKRLDYETI